MNDLLVASIKSTIDKADTYALTMLASSIAFAILCFPEAQKGQADQPVKWQLLGFPLNFQPPLALIVLYCIFFVSSMLTDNMLLHIGNLVRRINDQRLVSGVLTHPSVLTVSPIGRFLVTVVPGLFVLVGLWRLWSKGQYRLPGTVWFSLAGFALLGSVFVYLRVLTNIQRFQLPPIVSGT